MASAIDTNRRRQTRSFGVSPAIHFNSDSSRKRRKYANGGRQSAEEGRDASAASNYNRHYTSVNILPSLTSTAPRRRNNESSTPTYSSAAAAAAAAVQVDNYKPREERSWEDFHPELDIDLNLMVFNAIDVDGPKVDDSAMPTGANGNVTSGASPNMSSMNFFTPMPVKRRPGRPPRRPETVISGLGSSSGPRIVPSPAQNPKERLNLPKPSFRKKKIFESFERYGTEAINNADPHMAEAGFQETEQFSRPEPGIIRYVENQYDELLLSAARTPKKGSSGPSITPIGTISQVEYDMDEQDEQWLEAINATREEQGASPIRPGLFEITMTQIEKEWHGLEKRIPKPNPKPPQTQRPRSSSAAAVSGEPAGQGEEQDSKCAICDDGDCENTNAIVFCDGCDLAVHQECYGVPFIPEGQWLCRKCQFLGRGVPTCIFCPNTDGAFKLTHESKWAHLLCSIWIPEVSLGNLTFMEPIMEVAKVPRSRWKLNCYICNQKMGACIQCSNKNCYLAFHVTCARRAKLYLRTKSAQGGPPILDNNILKAYCDKHVSSDWQRDYNTAQATFDAKRFYRRAMKHREWADSQQSALSLISYQQQYEPSALGRSHAADNAVALTPAQKKKQQQARKNVWRLPSGAPIVPEILFGAVDSALAKFDLESRDEYVYEACKYWTLKREARRGAALLKRLQLQMDTFSSAEIARRDFVGMGSAGGPKLQRRIEFADHLLNDIKLLRDICTETKSRERQKFDDAHTLRQIVDTVYFPLLQMLLPILRKVMTLNESLHFRPGLRQIQSKLDAQQYTSVASFAMDLGDSFSMVLGGTNEIDDVAIEDVDINMDGITTGHTLVRAELAKHARTILNTIQTPLEMALQAEAELEDRSCDAELRRIESYLEGSIVVASEEDTENSNGNLLDEPNHRRSDGLPNNDGGSAHSDTYHESSDYIVDEPGPSNDIRNVDTPADTASVSPHSRSSGRSKQAAEKSGDEGTANEDAYRKSEETALNNPITMLTPPSSEKEKDTVASLMGFIPWYLKAFAPDGTSFYEETESAQENVRSTSDELSELDEAEAKAMDHEYEKSMAVESKQTLSSRKGGKGRKRARH